MSIRRDDGFTLLETLIALSIVSLVTVALLATFSFGETVMRHTRHERELTLEIVVVQDVLSRMLAELPATPAQMVVGSIDQLVIHGYPPRAAGSSMPARTTFRVDGRSKRLTAFWELVEPASRVVQRELLSTESDVRFSYLASHGEWSTAWQSQQPPKLVRIEIRTPEGLRRELVFATRSVNERGCRLMPQASCAAFDG